MNKKLLLVYSSLITILLIVSLCFFYSETNNYKGIKKNLVDHAHGNIVLAADSTGILLRNWDTLAIGQKASQLAYIEALADGTANYYRLAWSQESAGIPFVSNLYITYETEINTWKTALIKEPGVDLKENLKLLLSDFTLLKSFDDNKMIKLNNKDLKELWDKDIISKLKLKEVVNSYKG